MTTVNEERTPAFTYGRTPVVAAGRRIALQCLRGWLWRMCGKCTTGTLHAKARSRSPVPSRLDLPLPPPSLCLSPSLPPSLSLSLSLLLIFFSSFLLYCHAALGSFILPLSFVFINAFFASITRTVMHFFYFPRLH